MQSKDKNNDLCLKENLYEAQTYQITPYYFSLNPYRGVGEHMCKGVTVCPPLATLCLPLKNPFIEKILIPF